MPNIAITNFCNLTCPYCFADDMVKETKENISLEQYHYILQWISKTPENHIGIIGGEPCTHPFFSDIIKETNIYCRETNATATLFTNGIYLNKFLPEIGNKIHILINYNNPKNLTSEFRSKLKETLDHLYLLDWLNSKAQIGCNIYLDETNYDWIWEAVDNYQLKSIRVSITSPGGIYHKDWVFDKEKYYTKLVPVFIEFCKKAKEHNVICSMDCNRIPLCYFSKDEIELIEEVCDHYNSFVCDPVIDITMDFKATSCFGCYDPIDCNQFENVLELRRYLAYKKNYQRYQLNKTGKCIDCKNHELMKCQGGCLSFGVEQK